MVNRLISARAERIADRTTRNDQDDSKTGFRAVSRHLHPEYA